jgi:hypothetical protein
MVLRDVTSHIFGDFGRENQYDLKIFITEESIGGAQSIAIFYDAEYQAKTDFDPQSRQAYLVQTAPSHDSGHFPLHDLFYIRLPQIGSLTTPYAMKTM